MHKQDLTAHFAVVLRLLGRTSFINVTHNGRSSLAPDAKGEERLDKTKRRISTGLFIAFKGGLLLQIDTWQDLISPEVDLIFLALQLGICYLTAGMSSQCFVNQGGGTLIFADR